MKIRSSLRGLISAAALLAAPVAAQPQTPYPSNDPRLFLQTPAKPASLTGNLELVAIGELLYSRPMAESRDAEFQKVAKRLRGGDLTVAIQEGPFLDLRRFSSTTGSGGLWGEPTKAADQRALGIDMVALANNHSSDWGYEGLLETMRLLEGAGISHSGAGANQREARRAVFRDTPSGRIGLVATASTFKPYANATDAYGLTPARPGISALRLRQVNRIRPPLFAAIRTTAIESAHFSEKPPADDAAEVLLNGQIYRPSDRPGVEWQVNIFDHAEILRSVREAKEASDFVIFSIHAHETPTGMDDDNPEPPAFLKEVLRNTVDAGADFVLGGGLHSMRGIEIYKGKPILYGIGAFFLSGDIKPMQDTAYQAYAEDPNAPPPPLPVADADVTANPGGVNPPRWYDGVVAEASYDGSRLKEIRLYALDLGNSFDLKRRGIPHFASPTDALRILRELRANSAKLGTKIDIEKGVGVIRFP